MSAPPPRRSSRRSRRSPPPPPRRGAPAIRCSFSRKSCMSLAGPEKRSQVQPAFAYRVGEGGNPAVVGPAAPVEDGGRDPGGLRPLREERADLTGLGCLVAVGAPESFFQGRRGRDRPAHAVVDELDERVPGGPGDGQPGPHRTAHDLPADPCVPPRPRGGATLGPGLRDSHCYLPAFPTLRRTCSPWYRMPLPLYGSGLRSFRMLAAISPTCCLSIPSTTSRVGVSTRNVIPSGGVTVTGWLKPRANSRFDPRACTR